MPVAFECRACGLKQQSEVLLAYQNMPASAQGFLNQETLAEDVVSALDVVECRGCGLVQLNNPAVSYYRDVIRAAAYSEEMRSFRAQQFHHWVEQYALQNKKVLEVGCGRGEYLQLLEETGVNACGIEHAQTSVLACAQQGLVVAQGYLGDDGCMAFADTLFDGFVCLNFMEHWPMPAKSLQALHSRLRTGAIGLVEVPNFDMIVQKGLFAEFIADHLLYFTQKTLCRFLESQGFDVLSCTPVWQEYILSAVVVKRAPTDLRFFSEFKSRISQSLHAYLDRFSAGKVAVWGAGHQALAVIALAEIAQRIVCVVDSAPFKQGKYTPASHLPIVAPEAIESYALEAIIVMAASYSDEVARIIRQRYPQIQSLAVLRDDGLEEL